MGGSGGNRILVLIMLSILGKGENKGPMCITWRMIRLSHILALKSDSYWNRVLLDISWPFVIWRGLSFLNIPTIYSMRWLSMWVTSNSYFSGLAKTTPDHPRWEHMAIKVDSNVNVILWCVRHIRISLQKCLFFCTTERHRNTCYLVYHLFR